MDLLYVGPKEDKGAGGPAEREREGFESLVWQVIHGEDDQTQRGAETHWCLMEKTD